MSENLKEGNADAMEEIKGVLKDFSTARQALIIGVLRVLSDAMEHLKISIILPKMLENPKLVVKVLTGSPHERAIKLVQDFARRREIIIKEQRNPLMDHGMIMIIDYFQSHNDIYKQFQDYFHNLTAKEQKLIRSFEMLLESAKRHLEKDSIAHIQEERRLLKIYQENKRLKKDIARNRVKIALFNKTKRWKVMTKAVYTDKVLNEWNEKKIENEQFLENEADKINRKIRNFEKASVDNQNQIEQELNVTKIEFKKQDKESKITEKRTREEKNKLLLQLQSVVRKYDTTMAEKIIENLDLEDKLEKAKKELNNFMITYRAEEKIYNEIVVKRELREEREKMQKILKYMMNRAARKIQKYWKKWRKELKAKSKVRRVKRKY
ncbi:golgin subfamily A member 6-like protein 6 [Drosophila sulfurigaster albostrigata]|uniref:golgin subfamily A member 6-like protein 6 n=1 Tax=Drosophila sulfurigaster albostrigata TaxID=89887 RepID=UPI002D21AB1E|nr:golgin subfamily A member 6-like protein 6 [Drosophila sulfurigaster albostrigata]